MIVTLTLARCFSSLFFLFLYIHIHVYILLLLLYTIFPGTDKTGTGLSSGESVF